MRENEKPTRGRSAGGRGPQLDGALFSIGQMARLFDVNVRTLRYYDSIGLLEPEAVNAETGYRYYSSAQFERLNTILYLRMLDVPIAKIASFFALRDVGLMRGILEEQLRDVQEKQRRLALVGEKIARRIGDIDRAVGARLDEPGIRQLPARRVARLAESFAPSDDLEPLIRDLSRRSNLDGAIFLGKVGVSIARADLERGAFGRLSSVFVLLEADERREGVESVLPAGDYASVLFRGTHREAAPSYRRLTAFIEESGRRIGGDSVEVTLIDAGMTSDESRFVTEVQIPLEPLSSQPLGPQPGRPQRG